MEALDVDEKDSEEAKNYLEQLDRLEELHPEIWPTLLERRKELWTKMLLNETANALLSS